MSAAPALGFAGTRSPRHVTAYLDQDEHGVPGVTTHATVLHVDMDAFYASVSLVDRPELRDQPVLIGGAHRSVVLSATYPARAAGVTSGIPMARARRLCPQAVVVAPDYEAYAAASAGVMAILGVVTPDVEPVSMEEAFLQVRGAGRRWGDPVRIGHWIRDTVADEQGITCSVGIAPNRLVAKMASRHAKPDGLVEVRPHDVVPFLHSRPVEAIWGVGESTAAALHRLGLRTVADLAHTPLATLRRALGTSLGTHLHHVSWGHDPTPVSPGRPERSIGHSQTFAHDLDDPEQIGRQLLRLSNRTATRVRAAGVVGRTVVLTVRFSDFTSITRSRTLRESTDVTHHVHAAARELYDRLGLQRARVRLLGVRVEGLTPATETPVQGRLGEPEHGWREVEQVTDRIGSRFGSQSVLPASLLTGREPGYA